MNRREFLKKVSLGVIGTSLGVYAIKSFSDYFESNTTSVKSENSTQPFNSAYNGIPQYFFIIFIDGLSPIYINKFNPPNLMKIISESVYFPNAYVGHLTSNTIVSHAVANTGLFPKRWGIVDYGWRNTYLDENLSKIVPYGKAVNPGDYNLIVNYRLPDLIRAHFENDLPSFPYWLKSIYSDALAVGISTKQYMATYLIGMDIRIMAKNDNGNLVPFYQLGQAQNLVQDVIISSKDLLSKGDNWVIEVSKRIVENLKPRYMLINLPDVDLNAHIQGGPSTLDYMYNIVMNADRVLGEFIDSLKILGIYNKSAIVITADHGFSANFDYVDPKDIANFLSSKGISTDLVRGGSGYLTIWVSDPQYKDNNKLESAANALKSYFDQKITGIFYKGRFVIGDKIIFNYIPVLDQGRAEYVTLLDTMTCEQGPDIVIFYGDEMSGYPSYKGNHGGAGWNVQNIPIIIKAPNLPKGIVIETTPYKGPRLVDIAPTLISLGGDKNYINYLDGKDLTEVINIASSYIY
jgi:hypothetical protein